MDAQKGATDLLLVRMKTSTTTVEISVKAPIKAEGDIPQDKAVPLEHAHPCPSKTSRDGLHLVKSLTNRVYRLSAFTQTLQAIAKSIGCSL